MIRFAVPVLALVLLCACVDAQPTSPGSFAIVDAQVVKGQLQWTATVAVPVTKEIPFEVEINGQKVIQKKAETVFEYVLETRSSDLKNLKATDATGKLIEADTLAEMLKKTAPVVMASDPISEKHRKLFKDTTIFIELQVVLPSGNKK
jgi:hypothetical protein